MNIDLKLKAVSSDELEAGQSLVQSVFSSIYYCWRKL
jgi:hypothetical protein